jgi:hypothetical protein
VIFHINRATYEAGLSEEQRRAGLEMLRQSGAANPAVKPAPGEWARAGEQQAGKGHGDR